MPKGYLYPILSLITDQPTNLSSCPVVWIPRTMSIRWSGLTAHACKSSPKTHLHPFDPAMHACECYTKPSALKPACCGVRPYLDVVQAPSCSGTAVGKQPSRYCYSRQAISSDLRFPKRPPCGENTTQEARLSCKSCIDDVLSCLDTRRKGRELAECYPRCRSAHR
jgi:hypothetical protein